ncbi:UPF0665 family protein c [Aspergillus campestris IBT 28561]|uniref:UPF0665 family protein c n=1 Tax=Aspergillus campestris (strain IBT 28561) TaxID=1392248 RepID=A0A2I1CWV5_ASPC2|nr:UPF0665 family protein c [Aspergillus campestris IBT 28561]PKY02103.1 UPF0665 family protein c [Aspergillus campestris IBT 28561]
MVYYIRFLKTPRVQKQKTGALSVSALICITTDLGDAFLAEDVDLLISLNASNADQVLYQERVKWTASKREVPIALGPFPPHLSKHTLVLSVTAPTDPRKPRAPSADTLPPSQQHAAPLVIPGWSAPFGGSESPVAEKLVERRFGPQGLRIWEETGNSIARHIWDAALASVTYLQQLATAVPTTKTDAAPQPPVLHDLLTNCQNRSVTNPLHAVELGSGCGIVGISLAQTLPNCNVVLTDLPEVEDIVTQNISVAQPAPSSRITFHTLDWDDENLPEEVTNGGAIDLVLVSDCTYNADSLPALVSVLDRLVRASPDVLVIVALKRRHESEEAFFDLMRGAGLSSLHRHCMQLPAQHGLSDQIEIYCYARADGH